MRRLAYILAACICAAMTAHGGTALAVIETGTNTSGSATFGPVVGHVEEVVCDPPGAYTGTVVVSYQPLLSTMAAVNIATSTITGDKTWRPLVDGTDVAGAGLTSDGPTRRYLDGETVTFAVSGTRTGLTWKCWLKFSRE